MSYDYKTCNLGLNKNTLSISYVRHKINKRNFEKNNKVSIILPSFNRGKKCTKTISSILSQTYKNLELIVINDGSTKKDSDIIESYIKFNTDNRIKYIKHENIGQVKSINKGLDNTTGEFITYISDDNEIKEDFIEKLVYLKSDFAYSNYTINNKNLMKNKHHNVKQLINNFMGMTAVMWKKEIVKKIGYFNESLSGLCEDYDYEIRTFLATKNIIHIDNVLIDYSTIGNTQSKKNYKLQKETHNIIQKFYNLYLDNLSIKDTYIICYCNEHDSNNLNKYPKTYGKINICENYKNIIKYENDILYIDVKYKELIYNILIHFSNKNKNKYLLSKFLDYKLQKLLDGNIIKKISDNPQLEKLTNNIVKKMYDVDINFFSNNKLLGKLFDIKSTSNTYTKNVKISFIMSHRNRVDLLLFTLYQLNKSKQNNFEVVIVDDRSDYDISYINNLGFKYPIKLIRKDGDYNKIVCPGSLYNIAFEKSVGDIIVIQNPECVHLNDIPDYINNFFNYDDYISFPCYSSNNIKVNDYILDNIDKININNVEKLTKHFNNDEKYKNYPIWFQHPKINNRNLHFCTVISREYYKILGGFSEEYSNGFCFEDDDLIFNIKEKLKLNVISVKLEQNVGVIHMYHGRSSLVNITPHEKTIEKRAIYERYHLNESIFKYKKLNNKIISCPKLFHYYWDDFRKFSFMNLYSLRSSIYYHSDYIHIIWCPKSPQENITWKEFCNKDFNQDPEYIKYIEEIKNMKNVRIIYKNMEEFLEVDNTMSEIHKSDLFRYKILHEYGGIWSDLDIVYIKPITDIIKQDFDTINFLCMNKNYHYFPIGLLLSKRKSFLFKYIFDEAIKNYDPNLYQCLGSELFYKLFDKTNDKFIIKNNKQFSGKNILFNEEFYMKYNWKCINDLFINKTDNLDLSKSVGFHWFNGSDVTKKYLKDIINFTIPDKFNGIIFKEKYKYNLIYNDVRYFIFDKDEFNYYTNKKKYYINVLEELKPKPVYFGKYLTLDQKTFNDVIKNKHSLYIFDEISYVQLLLYYNFNESSRNNIVEFLLNNKYLFFFSELIYNDSLQTIGNKIVNKEFSLLFFKQAYKVFLCNIKNINFLINNGIYENLSYFPGYGYSDINEIKPLKSNVNKNIDVLFYGNVTYTFEHRINYINHLSSFCDNNNIVFKSFNNLYEEKDETLKQTKIVIHIPSHPNLHTFPWAKVVELMCKKIFFIIEENEEMYIKKLENVIVYYKNKLDLQQKIKYYLKEDKEREKYINLCYNYIIENYNMDDLIKKLLNI